MMILAHADPPHFSLRCATFPEIGPAESSIPAIFQLLAGKECPAEGLRVACAY